VHLFLNSAPEKTDWGTRNENVFESSLPEMLAQGTDPADVKP
jgi:hypothetical protein